MGGVGEAPRRRARSLAARRRSPRGDPRLLAGVRRAPAAHSARAHRRRARARACHTTRAGGRRDRAGLPGRRAAGRPALPGEPDDALERLVEQMRAFWDAALAPWWPRISAALEAEISARARALAALGPQAAFTGLHQTVRWEGDTLYVHPTKKAATDVDLANRGLLLVPAVFTWPSVWPRTDPPWDPALVYPPPGTADLWRPDPPRAEALEALLGARRARVLLELDRPACTSAARPAHERERGRREQPPLGAEAGGPRQPAPRGPPRDLHPHRPSATPSPATPCEPQRHANTGSSTAIHPLADPAAQRDLSELEEDRAGRRVDEIVAERELEHGTLALRNRDEPRLAVEQRLQADAVCREHLIGVRRRGVASPAHQSTTGVTTNPERVA